MTAALLAAVLVFLLVTLPPAPERLSLDGVASELRARTVPGAYHVHTTRSDGVDGKARVAAAAARAGLKFVIFSDHGDGMQPADAPAYVEGVLCIDAVEISTNGGHYVALGMGAVPYPLGGEPAAVVEDVARLGGFGIAAHPEHSKGQLAWTDWRAPVDGIEWINADSEWRTDGALALTRVLFDYLFRPAPAIASVLDKPERTIEQWDVMSRARRIVALAAVDAHGGGRAGVEEEPRLVVGPSYEASFRTLSNRAVLERPLSGDPATDAELVLDAVRAGTVYSVIDAVSPDVVVALDPTGPRVVSPLPDGARVSTVADGGRLRLEAYTPRSPGEPQVPWVLTNWVGAPVEEPPVPARPMDVSSAALLALGPWRVEKDDASTGQVAAADGEVTLRFELASGQRRSQYVAAAADLAEAAPFDAVAFRGRAARPIRMSVQLRFAPDDRRWTRSIYLDSTEREVLVPVGDLLPADAAGGRVPQGSVARSLLVVVDLVNARPGDAGELTIRDLRVVR